MGAGLMRKDFAVGADLSFLKSAEDAGAVFRDHGRPMPGLQIFRHHGYNWIRLRLFHTPAELPNNLDYTIAVASEAKRLGYRFLLNFHYSDTWADPGKQTIPRAWEGLSCTELVKTIFQYTHGTIEFFIAAGAAPDMVQPGNEITAGMLWPHGKLPENWPQFAELLKAAIDGVRAASPARVMIHIDRGGDREGTRGFFDRIVSLGIDYDVIGQSYYPWWHGTLEALQENLAFMSRRYGKDIFVVETAYCWRPAEYTDKEGPFPETPAGQRQFLEQVKRAVYETPDGRGAGVFWWEPAVTGRLRCRGMFDDEGNTLPVMTVFDPWTDPPACQ
jgi:arabinogalactan endo-1,4-beta-galactosidase